MLSTWRLSCSVISRRLKQPKHTTTSTTTTLHLIFCSTSFCLSKSYSSLGRIAKCFCKTARAEFSLAALHTTNQTTQEKATTRHHFTYTWVSVSVFWQIQVKETMSRTVPMSNGTKYLIAVIRLHAKEISVQYQYGSHHSERKILYFKNSIQGHQRTTYVIFQDKQSTTKLHYYKHICINIVLVRTSCNFTKNKCNACFPPSHNVM